MDVNGIGCKRDSRFIRLVWPDRKAGDSCRVVAARKHAPSAPPRTHSLRAFDDDRKALTHCRCHWCRVARSVRIRIRMPPAAHQVGSVHRAGLSATPPLAIHPAGYAVSRPAARYLPGVSSPCWADRVPALAEQLVIMVYYVATWCTMLQHGVLCCNMVYYVAARAGRRRPLAGSCRTAW